MLASERSSQRSRLILAALLYQQLCITKIQEQRKSCTFGEMILSLFAVRMVWQFLVLLAW